MTLRTFTDKNGNEWNWEETPEVVEALKNCSGNYAGSFYTPHPNLKRPNEYKTPDN